MTMQLKTAIMHAHTLLAHTNIQVLHSSAVTLCHFLSDLKYNCTHPLNNQCSGTQRGGYSKDLCSNVYKKKKITANETGPHVT